MPYVKKTYRPILNLIVKELQVECVHFRPGFLNYILFKYCKEIKDPNYEIYRNFIGELNECVAEIRRSLLGPHEEKAKKKNGAI